MNKKMIILAIMSVSFISGCSISIGGGSSENTTQKDIVYDCSVLTDTAQQEMTKRYKQCGDSLTAFAEDCRQQVIQSVCKPIIKNREN